MIDVESMIYDPIAKALRTAFPGIDVTGIYVPAPSKLPHVSIEEIDNYTTLSHRDSSGQERYATITYEVNVYSDKATGKKSECRKIMALIDSLMTRMNFSRITMAPVPNQNDSTIYRLTARYRAESDGTTIYRR